MQIVLATQNKSKMAEIQSLFENAQIQLVMLSDYCQDEIEESGFSFIENALIKARFAAQKTGLPAIADDSGLVVPALNGAPGIYSARYAGQGKTNDDHLKKLLQEMEAIPLSKRDAIMHCTMVFMRAPMDPIPLIAEGDWHGHIIHERRGREGFGYDPVFWLSKINKTAAELSMLEKNKQSHRFQALTKLKEMMAEKLCMPCLLEN